MSHKIGSILQEEEERSTKFFLTLFYVIYFLYEFFYFYLLPKLSHKVIHSYPSQGLGVWLYIFILSLIPISIVLMKRNLTYTVKYVVYLSYLGINLVHETIIYSYFEVPFSAGNFVEIVVILFAPIFVNKRFFLTVVIGTIFKYLLVGILIQDSNVIFPAVLILIISLLTFLVLNRLAGYFNAVHEAYVKLNKSERLATIGQMAAGIVHEIRNPLTSIQGFVKLMQKSGEIKSSYTTIILEELERINTIVENLLLIGKTKSNHYSPQDCNKLLDYVIAVMKPQAINNNVYVERIFESIPLIYCEENQLKQVFLNVMKNAIEAMPNGGKLTIKAFVEDRDYVTVQFIDEGYGIPKEQLVKIGEPFYSTKVNGTGLGIMMCYKIIEEHNGHFLIESQENNGTKVTIKIPKA
jgi:signal transduction histidine kinase